MFHHPPRHPGRLPGYLQGHLRFFGGHCSPGRDTIVVLSRFPQGRHIQPDKTSGSLQISDQSREQEQISDVPYLERELEGPGGDDTPLDHVNGQYITDNFCHSCMHVPK